SQRSTSSPALLPGRTPLPVGIIGTARENLRVCVDRSPKRTSPWLLRFRRYLGGVGALAHRVRGGDRVVVRRPASSGGVLVGRARDTGSDAALGAELRGRAVHGVRRGARRGGPREVDPPPVRCR